MGLVPRAAALTVALVAGALSVACGGSVVDSDSRAPTRATAAPASPFCAAARANADAIRPLNGLVARGGVASQELSTTVDAVRRSGAALLLAAPGDIRSDVERTVAAVDQQLDALVASGGNAAALKRDPDLAAMLGSPELVSSVERVTTYVNRTCGTGAAAR